MAKYLIVNADDYGMCNSANTAVAELFEGGFLKSATVMMPCPTAKDAVQFSIDHPEYPIGIHLTMTSEWANTAGSPLPTAKRLSITRALCGTKATTLRRTHHTLTLRLKSGLRSTSLTVWV
ncbi:MAG: ChbG/HpnK family deacetylase [Clostridia bacterium]|nr:ChbG/HpnK family deacetylase [Clostridia bacterium]